MLVTNVIEVVERNKNKEIETVKTRKDFYDILVKYMGYEVANWFDSYDNNLKNKVEYLENEVESLYKLP